MDWIVFISTFACIYAALITIRSLIYAALIRIRSLINNANNNEDTEA